MFSCCILQFGNSELVEWGKIPFNVDASRKTCCLFNEEVHFLAALQAANISIKYINHWVVVMKI
jgi:hypothetical protein